MQQCPYGRQHTLIVASQDSTTMMTLTHLDAVVVVFACGQHHGHQGTERRKGDPKRRGNLKLDRDQVRSSSRLNLVRPIAVRTARVRQCACAEAIVQETEPGQHGVYRPLGCHGRGWFLWSRLIKQKRAFCGQLGQEQTY